VLREGVAVHIKRVHYSWLAKELGVSGDALIAFAAGGELPAATLQKLARELFAGHAMWDAELDLLKAVNSEVKPLGTAPEPHDPERQRYPEPTGPWTRGGLGPLPVSLQAHQGKKPGWV
jgi:hypothetical protein